MLDFLGIGAQKAGTTWLYDRLARHESVSFPAGKEVHFWDANRSRGLEWYCSLFAGDEPGKRRGEITPAYAILPPEVIAEIYRLNPRLRIFYLIRNPIDRAWSSALMALDRAEMKIGEASDQWFIDHFRSAGSLLRGDYEQCLRNWHREFPREQILVLRHEMIREAAVPLLSACFRHLGIDPDFPARVPTPGLLEPVFPGPGHPLRPSLLPVLRALYLPKIESLSAYMDIDLSDWLKSGGLSR